MRCCTGTKETAFVYAATSAGVAHAVTEACSAGNLTDCSCDSGREDDTAPDGWKWGGCSDNVRYGLWFSESFVDAPDRDRQRRNGFRDVRALMNLHNNEVGRKVGDELFFSALSASLFIRVESHIICRAITGWTVALTCYISDSTKH